MAKYQELDALIDLLQEHVDQWTRKLAQDTNWRIAIDRKLQTIVNILGCSIAGDNSGFCQYLITTHLRLYWWFVGTDQGRRAPWLDSIQPNHFILCLRLRSCNTMLVAIFDNCFVTRSMILLCQKIGFPVSTASSIRICDASSSRPRSSWNWHETRYGSRSVPN